ncbi:hypothetical protein TNCV_4029301 [Trichonephila clavipes]|nr:hypothetical protein TNCV_4029301 [Trichonephila clavipes]
MSRRTLTFSEIFSKPKSLIQELWKTPPTHPWYNRQAPGGALSIKADRVVQTTISRLASGHIRGLSFNLGQIFRGYREDSESHSNVGLQMPLLRTMLQRRREKEQNKQHINWTGNILLKNCNTTGARNYDQKSSGRTKRRYMESLEFWKIPGTSHILSPATDI